MTLTRRELLTRGAAGAGVVAVGNLAGVFGAPLASAGGRPDRDPGYGALIPDPAGLLDLPRGFKYSIVSQEGTPLTAAGVVPGRFDGTGAFPAPRRGTYLVRNSEYGGAFPAATPVVGDPSITYDPASFGGTTTVQLDKHDQVVGEAVSLAGTASNCAGGITPWCTWLSCEEDESRAGAFGQTKDHGFVFEVDPANPANNVDPTPITGMGRFPHEAVAVDPHTGSCYLTEDASKPFGLVYRYEPVDTSHSYGALRNGGALTAMSCSLDGTHIPDLAFFSNPGQKLQVEWVPVPDPLAATTSTRAQFADSEVTRSRKFEGAFWGDNRVYIVCSFREGIHAGQVWSYRPQNQTLRLEVFLAVGDTEQPGDSPDNICVSPYGGLILAEDGDGTQYLLAVDDDGQTSGFARNARDDSEFTGCVFSPDCKTLFANIQEPGITFAITGPFRRINRR